jgi:protoporphyrin/coproporphyrin ferrochelatase
MAPESGIDAVLIVGFGGPTRPDEIRPFLDNVLRGRPIPPERYEEVVRHYETIGGRSPYNDLTARQAAALRERLAREGAPIPVFIGMRNWTPYLDERIRELGRAGARRTLALIMAAHRCEASWDRYQAVIADACAKVRVEQNGYQWVDPIYPEPWHTNPKFIAAAADRAGAALAQLPDSDRARAQMIFTAHSIPVAMNAASGYADQITETCELVAKRLGQESWTLAFQSRSGSPRDAWLEPDVNSALRRIDRPAVVVPIGFLCDHVEVLYDLDIEAAKIAREAGIKMVRAGTVWDHPAFIEMLAEIVRKHAGI